MKRQRATKVKPLKNYKLLLTFENGEKRIYDVKPLIKGEWFGELTDQDYFNTVHIAGLSVEWSGGQDICPDDLYFNSKSIDKEVVEI